MSNIILANRNLRTLKGQNIPEVVDGHFICVNNNLTSLQFGPKEVSGNYFCHDNKLTNLQFGPVKVGGSFWCNNNNLTSLEFAPNKVALAFSCHDNKLTTLHGIHKQFKDGYITQQLEIQDNPLKSHLLGVVLIPKLEQIIIDNTEVERIINKHLTTRDVLECQEELIQNGFKEFAQL